MIKFRRTGRNGELTVDSQAPVGGLSKGGYTQLTLTLDLFVGGHRNFDEVAKKAQIRTAFRGCVQKVRALFVMCKCFTRNCVRIKDKVGTYRLLQVRH